MIAVSVIVPVYNAEKHLRQCLDSLCGQSLPDIEFICVNDGSTDGSLTILNEYARKDGRFTVVDQANCGSGQSRNNGLKVARGEYVGFVDADDIVSRNYFETLYAAGGNGECDIVATSRMRLFADGGGRTREKDVGLKTKRHVIQDVYGKSQIILASGSVCNKIYKRSFLIQDEIGFVDVKISSEDNYFTDCAVIKAREIRVVKKATYFYRENWSSQTKTELDCRKALMTFDVYSRTLEYVKGHVPRNERTLWMDVIKRRAKLDVFTYAYGQVKAEEKETFLKEANGRFGEFPTTLVVSLTSFPARIGFVHKTIETLLNQSMKADKVVLYLAKEQFKDGESSLPKPLLALRERGLEVRWCEDLKSYKKLVPALREYPDAIIVTADDDILYPSGWLNDLYVAYLRNPSEIQCHRANRICFDREGRMLPYRNWTFGVSKVKPSCNNFLVGAGGVLYPPHILDEDVLNAELFTRICPTADDIWFWAMAVLGGAKINVIGGKQALKYVEGSQDGLCLCAVNLEEGRNDVQMRNVLGHYPQILEKLDKNDIKDPRGLSLLEKVFSFKSQGQGRDKRKVLTVFGIGIELKHAKTAGRK